jgi:CheY-like chemotaxis protein
VKRILIVEDEPAIAELLASFFEEEGYELMLASNGKEALQLLTEKLPNVILSDMMMPLLNGVELCRALQSKAEYRAIPFILMSAVENLISQDPCHYVATVQKPFKLDALLELVNAVA